MNMNPREMLNYLEMLANNSLWINFTMHMIVLIAFTVVIAVNKQTLKRWTFQGTIGIIFFSVTVHALIFGNPFHAATFGLLAIISLVQLIGRKETIQISQSKWISTIALSAIFLGLWYPEFVDKSALMLLMVSPVGVIPCPTLLITIGLLILIMPSVSSLQYLITIIMGLVYGIIGVFVFQVYLDITLLILVLAASWIFYKERPQANTGIVLYTQGTE
ncbi:hypothetical protein Desor_0437 [Desulfosporosinus orientis DSM 765]|uniref:Uncharacterized protein n=1 Tax=Desulfosporosinus orientis (strain ATCC 19365 / DSM 765 / NCIMB 8382 / VKM B-1628 / Singapore I) TaxID=768706 RepID=G7W7S6_DESOD|nr:DUF6064 family protein [Desulfosporosinus orientis]AET66141.1 hypothetical protein Desor_0437 [Desulfosporosinus orientis DSM 765]